MEHTATKKNQLMASDPESIGLSYPQEETKPATFKPFCETNYA